MSTSIDVLEQLLAVRLDSTFRSEFPVNKHHLIRSAVRAGRPGQEEKGSAMNVSATTPDGARPNTQPLPAGTSPTNACAANIPDLTGSPHHTFSAAFHIDQPSTDPLDLTSSCSASGISTAPTPFHRRLLLMPVVALSRALYLPQKSRSEPPLFRASHGACDDARLVEAEVERRWWLGRRRWPPPRHLPSQYRCR